MHLWMRLLDAWRRWRRQRARYVLDTVRVSESEVDQAIRQGCVQAGVQLDRYAPDLDLGPKAHEVLIHAGRSLGYRLRTIQDIQEWLR